MIGQGNAPRSGCALLAALLCTVAARGADEPAKDWNLFPAVQSSLTWLPAAQEDGLGVTELDVNATFTVPVFGDLAPLKITPGFVARSWEGPTTEIVPGRPDLPPQVYDLNLDFGWRPRLAEWLFVDLGFTPGLYTDLRSLNDSFRLRGRALTIVALSERLQIVGGLLYTNRNNTKILPAGGVLWSPDDDTKLELLFPQPKLSRRFVTTRDGQWWGYVAGEFGGGAWSVQRDSGVDDSVDYRDIRALLGVEHVNACGVKWRAEVGYVFGRRVDFVSNVGDYDPAATILLRAGLSY